MASQHEAGAQARMGEALLAAADPCPGTALEASVITAATPRRVGDCQFEVLNACRT